MRIFEFYIFNFEFKQMLASLYSFIFLAAESAGHQSGDGGFVNFWNTYFNFPGFELWRFINLAIFIAIMIYILKKPLSETFKAKREAIRADLIRAEQARQSALAELTATEAKFASLAAEKANIIERARQEAEAEARRITEQTEFEANRLREQATSEIERSVQHAQFELRRFSAEESIRLAEEKIKNQINTDKDKNLIKASIQAIGGLN